MRSFVILRNLQHGRFQIVDAPKYGQRLEFERNHWEHFFSITTSNIKKVQELLFAP